jgi:hypothetical protein
MTKKNNQYVGKAGHLFVMSEFLARGYNVAIPEVDVGDDILVLEDSNGSLFKVQVKTSNITKRKNSYSAQFQLNYTRLINVIDVPTYYVFVVRLEDSWAKLLLILQGDLLSYIQNDNMGTHYGDTVTLYFAYTPQQITCSNIDLSAYLDNYQDFPAILH